MHPHATQISVAGSIEPEACPSGTHGDGEVGLSDVVCAAFCPIDDTPVGRRPRVTSQLCGACPDGNATCVREMSSEGKCPDGRGARNVSDCVCQARA